MTVSTEIVDAVQQLLEKEGVLQSIRAQLRSSVINALATKDGERRASKTVEFTGKESGRGSILCVMDLLQKLNLRETMAVFEAEVGMIQTDVITESARCDIMQRLNIVASLRDLDEPILYQLLENPSNKSSEKGTIPRKTQDVYHQSESKISSLIPKVAQDSASSASSILKSDGAFPERDFKQYDDAPRKVERRNSYEGQSAGPRGSLGYDGTDDSVADEKKSSEYTKDSAKDHKNNGDNRKFGLMAKHSADSDESRDRDLSEDEILPEEEEDVEEDVIEVGGDSGSSASFSLEYGYVDDPKSAVVKNETVDIIEKGANAFANDDKNERGIKSSPLQSIESKKVHGNSSVQESSSVGVKKFDQGSVTRSKTGWNEVTAVGGDNDSDEFLFSEEPESSAISASPKSALKKGLDGPNLNKYDSMKTSSDQEIAKESKGLGASSSKSPQVARQSWGRNTDSKEVTRDGNDKANHSKCDVENENEDEEAKSLSDDDDVINLEQLGRISGARIGKKSTNQEDEEEKETRKENNSSGSGSLFKSRNLTGPGSTSQHGSQSIQSSSSTTKKLSISIDEEDDGSVEFGPDDDGDLDFTGATDTVTASPNSKLTEVERKLAQMEKDDVGLKSLRLQDDKASKAAAKDTDVGANSEVEGDYSEGDFESDSENNSVVEANEVSMASEDIEVMELSVGGAGSDSDSSLNAFNTDSSKRLQDKDKGKGSSLWSNSSPPNKDTTSTHREPIKPKSSGTQKSKDQDENEVSQSSTELEISVTELELTGSKGIDGNSGYDFTAAAVPPSKSNWGPRDRTSGR